MKRQSLLLVAPRQLKWVEEYLPEPSPDEILVETTTCAVSIGTELQYYRGAHRGSQAIRYPKMTGYESVGRVTASGKDVHHVAVGDRVLAFYGHRTHALLKMTRFIPIPADISDALALLAILSCDVTKGIMKTRITSEDKVLVTGAGTIGLLTTFNLKKRGVKTVDVIEPIAERRELALQVGASQAVQPADVMSDIEMYGVGFECSGRDQAFGVLQQRIQPQGKICILSDGNIEPLTLSPHFHEKEVSVIGSSDGEDYPGHAAWFFEQVRGSVLDLEKLYEKAVVANDLASYFEEMVAMSVPPIKVLVRYGDE